ncbi:MAG: hypothetical protein PHI63_04765 [Patescibacteria group bacterium]|nr:hypothetical protein [Patescibacteria group bacterium]
MTDQLKNVLLHGLETLGNLVLSFLLSWLVKDLLPVLPQTPVWIFIAGLVAVGVKTLREAGVVKDYTNLGKARQAKPNLDSSD